MLPIPIRCYNINLIYYIKSIRGEGNAGESVFYGESNVGYYGIPDITAFKGAGGGRVFIKICSKSTF